MPHWTTTPPLEPGWYWVIDDADDVEIVEVFWEYGYRVLSAGLDGKVLPLDTTRIKQWWTERSTPPSKPEPINTKPYYGGLTST